jgi:hypothetical protein
MKGKLPSKKAGVSSQKAKQILSDGETRGNPLTPKQKGLFGAIAGGAGGGMASGTPPKPKSRPTLGAIGERPIPAKTQTRMTALARAQRRSKA